MIERKLTIREQDRLDMLRAFQKLTPEERHRVAEERLDEILQSMAELYGITPGQAYERLITNRDRWFQHVRQQNRLAASALIKSDDLETI